MDILHTITRFPACQNSDKVNETKVKKNLELPSVLTVAKWLELKKAMEDEKDEMIRQKEEQGIDARKKEKSTKTKGKRK